MSLFNTRLPGLLPKVECTPACMACIAIDNASSSYCAVLAIFCGGLPSCNSVLRTFPTLWCILSHTALDCGFFAVVHTSLMWQFCNSVWNSDPVNSVPGSCTQCWGHGLGISQHCANYLTAVFNLLSSILMSLTKLVTVSITVSALNLYRFPWTWTVQGLIRSVAHSSNGIKRISCSGGNPYPLPLIYFFGNNCTWSCQQICINHYYNVVDVRVDRAFLHPGCPVTGWYHLIVGTIRLFDNTIFQLAALSPGLV